MSELVKDDNNFSFEISLSVLNHLGRNLYRSFATVLGEAISNAWDADAKNVWVYIDKKKNSFIIKDDGFGMDRNDFQNKFLKIGYTKRKTGKSFSPNGRPYIGRKGIGKLALLSCAKRITVISKKKGGNYTGGIIDNSGLDKAIKQDLHPKAYQLMRPNLGLFKQYIEGHDNGTLIYFENINEGIKNSLDLLKKVVALYFRFSLLDETFNIYIDGEKITHKQLAELGEKTEFLWRINNLEDPFVTEILTKVKEKRTIAIKGKVDGFIASVKKPRDLKVMGTEERVSVDLFVNGRLREMDILKHMPSARIPESYLYGQIHFNDLDDAVDRFTSSREGVVADDPKYTKFLSNLKKKIVLILDDWDKWRLKHGKDGDSENKRLSPKERKSRELFGAVSDEYTLPKNSKNKNTVEGWVNDLRLDASFNFGSYAECFVSENLIRKYIQEKQIPITAELVSLSKDLKNREKQSKAKGNISIDVRRLPSALSYLDMDSLAKLVDNKQDRLKDASLLRDATEYKPIRDAIAHTALLTDPAKAKLTAVFFNIKARIKNLIK
jgi:hypothetical protein